MYQIKPSTLQGEITIPASKSHSLRAILFGALGIGKTTVYDFLPSPDIFAMIQACKSLGAQIEVDGKAIEIIGTGGIIKGADDVIQAGNSGIILRFVSAVAALGTEPIVVTGDHSIRFQRPMQPMIDALKQLGVKAQSTRGNGFAPLIIQGPLKPGFVKVLGEDSQFVSSLLIASAISSGPVEIAVTNPGEKPWVALTLDWFKRLEIPYEHDGYERFWMRGDSQFKGFHYHVPGDLSTLAFPVAAALITHSELLVHNVDLADCQGDKVVIDILKQMGAQIEVDSQSKCLKIHRGSKLQGIAIDMNPCIDAITLLAVIGCYAEGKTILRNGQVAKNKECNRIECITKELRKMGAEISELPDGLEIKAKKLHGALVDSHQDHRMAMSLAVAALGAKGETTIRSVECISKTYPTFKEDLNRIGAHIEEVV